jgi:hypothetical protein
MRRAGGAITAAAIAAARADVATPARGSTPGGAPRRAWYRRTEAGVATAEVTNAVTTIAG